MSLYRFTPKHDPAPTAAPAPCPVCGGAPVPATRTRSAADYLRCSVCGEVWHPDRTVFSHSHTRRTGS